MREDSSRGQSRPVAASRGRAKDIHGSDAAEGRRKDIPVAPHREPVEGRGALGANRSFTPVVRQAHHEGEGEAPEIVWFQVINVAASCRTSLEDGVRDGAFGPSFAEAAETAT